MQKAFSLVELSIVLVILGLLVGGVLSGQSLIKAAQLRAVTVEEQKYIAATQSFRNKYFALPGDMTNATAFWGTSSSGCIGQGNSGLDNTGATCNGNGDGMITFCDNPSFDCKEPFWFWMHLAKAGLIEGNYTGYSIISNTGPVAGVNVPGSKFSNAVWGANNLDYTGTNTAYYYAINFANHLTLTGPNGNVLSAEDAWNIDTKMDDGMPGTGKVIGGWLDLVGYTGAWGANKCTTSSGANDFTGTYALRNTGPLCLLYFRQAF